MKEMTMDNFLTNPVGKGSAAVGARGIIIPNLEMRYHALMHNFGMKMIYKVYMTKTKDYIFRFSIPSEEYGKKLSYDVVLKFSPNKLHNKTSTLRSYYLQVFSNSLNFFYTYSYVYNQEEILIPELKHKLDNMFLNTPPDVRNPDKSFGFEKSVYFCLLYIKEHKLTSKHNLKAEMFSMEAYETIKTSKEKIAEHNKVKQMMKKDKSRNKRFKKLLKKAKLPIRKKF